MLLAYNRRLLDTPTILAGQTRIVQIREQERANAALVRKRYQARKAQSHNEAVQEAQVCMMRSATSAAMGRD